MAREFFKNLPDTTTPLNAQRMNSFLNGEEAMGSIVVDDITCKNFLDLSSYAGNISEGITYAKNDDDSINLSGTKTSSSSTYEIISYVTLPAGTYTLSGCPSDGGTSTYAMLIVKVSGTTVLGRDYGYGATFTVAEPTYCRVQINVYTSEALSKVFYPMIEKGSTKTNYAKHKEYDNADLKGKILWVNPNPTEAMAYQYGGINLSSSDYDVLEFYFYNSTDNKAMTVQKTMAGYGVCGMYINGYGGLVYSRAISYVSKTSYTINECYRYGYGATTPPAGSNTFLIPAYVIGYKNSIGTNPTTSTASVEE